MDWKSDSNLLAKKIHERIEGHDGEISYSELEKIAIDKEINLNIFDRAITQLHKHKKITQRVKGEEIYYKPTPRKKKKDPFAVQKWVNENYPRPVPCKAKGCTGLCKKCEPFPEIDMSWIVLKPAEMLEYKAQAKGIPLHMMKKIHKK